MSAEPTSDISPDSGTLSPDMAAKFRNKLDRRSQYISDSIKAAAAAALKAGHSARRFLTDPIKKSKRRPVSHIFAISVCAIIFVSLVAFFGQIQTKPDPGSGEAMFQRPSVPSPNPSGSTSAEKDPPPIKIGTAEGESTEAGQKLDPEPAVAISGAPGAELIDGVTGGSDGKARYDIDPLTLKPPSLFERSGELFACDRRHWRTDVCVMKGDVRVDARTNLAVLYARQPETRRGVEVLKPYTRKWELDLMKKVDDVVMKSVDAPENMLPWLPATEEELLKKAEEDHVPKEPPQLPLWDEKAHLGNATLWSDEVRNLQKTMPLENHMGHLGFFEGERHEIGARMVARGGVMEKVERHGWIVFNKTKRLTLQDAASQTATLHCDIRHSVPGVIFSTAGYTGNIYHEFNDGLIPLYITTQHFKGNFVPIVDSARLWWFLKYENVFRQLSNYPAVRLGMEEQVHCFTHLIVGLHIHDELTVYPQLLPKANGSIQKFQRKLHVAWKDWPFLKPKPEGEKYGCKPVFNLISRSGTRVLTNEKEVLGLAEEMGFFIRKIEPDFVVPLAWIWDSLQSSNVMLGVHGAAMTHFLFMRPNSAYIQVLPIGTEWAAKVYYGDPAIRLGLQYTEYRVDYEESSLSALYPRNHTIIQDPQAISDKGWWAAKATYLQNQNVTLNLTKLRKVLENVKVQLLRDPLYISHQSGKARSIKCRE